MNQKHKFEFPNHLKFSQIQNCCVKNLKKQKHFIFFIINTHGFKLNFYLNTR